jgi:hypothetical protein
VKSLRAEIWKNAKIENGMIGDVLKAETHFALKRATELAEEAGVKQVECRSEAGDPPRPSSTSRSPSRQTRSSSASGGAADSPVCCWEAFHKSWQAWLLAR